MGKVTTFNAMTVSRSRQSCSASWREKKLLEQWRSHGLDLRRTSLELLFEESVSFCRGPSRGGQYRKLESVPSLLCVLVAANNSANIAQQRVHDSHQPGICGETRTDKFRSMGSAGPDPSVAIRRCCQRLALTRSTSVLLPSEVPAM